MKSGDFYDLKNANRVPAALARFNQPVPDMLGAQGSAAHAAAQLKIIAPGQPSNFSSMANAHARGFQQKIGAGPGRVVTGAQIKVTRDQNILNIFNHIKHSEPIYNARHAMLHQEVKHAATALRQFNAVHQTRLQPQNICPAIQSFNNLSNLTISARPLNDLLKKAIHDIQKEVTNQKSWWEKIWSYRGNLSKKITKIIDSLESQSLDWLNDSEFYFTQSNMPAPDQCLEDTLKFIAVHKINDGDWLDTNFIHNPAKWDFTKIPFTPYDQKFHESVVNNHQNQDLLKLDQLCVAGNLHDARAMAVNSQSDLSAQVYNYHFWQQCNENRIFKIFENDPQYSQILSSFPTVALTTLEKLPTLHPANEVLSERLSIMYGFCERLSINEPSPEVQKILYGWVDEYQKGDAQNFGLFLAEHLSSDHTNPLMQPWYDKMFTNGLPKDLGIYNEVAAQITIPATIGKTEYTNERRLFYELATSVIQSEHQAGQTIRALKHLNAALGLTPEAPYHKILAHENGKALLDPQSSKKVLALADYTPSKALPVHQQAIQNAAVKLIAQNIDALKETIPAATNTAQKVNSQTIDRVDNAYQAMLKGNVQAEDYLDRGLVPKTNLNVLSIDFDKQAEFFKASGLHSAIERRDTLNNIIHKLEQLGVKHGFKDFELSAPIKQFMLDHNLTPEHYMRVYGNEIQFALHEDSLNQINKEHQLLSSGTITDNALRECTNSAVQITDAGRAYNKVGDVVNASYLSNFCWQILDYVEKSCSAIDNAGVSLAQAVAKGIGSAGLDKAHDLYGMACNPVGSVKNCITSLGNLGITALKLVEQIDNTLGELTLHGPERRHEALKDINRQNEALITTVVDFAKEHGLEGIAEKVAYHGTSLVLDTVLIDKAATAVNKFATIANASMTEVAHEAANAATKAPELEAITAEGIAVKVPQSAEICALSEAQEGIRQVGRLGNNAELSTNKIKNCGELTQKCSREKMLPKVKTYEQARNQALEIIGEVNPHSGQPHLGKQGICKDNLVGRTWHGDKVTIRLDHDPIKGPHINLTDYRAGKGTKGTSIYIPFEGTKETVAELLKHLNSPASLKTAKAVFEKSCDEKSLAIVINKLSKL